MKHWSQGRASIDKLLLTGQLQRVPANREWADQLILIAAEQFNAAQIVLPVSPLTSFQTSYDAMHKVFDAVLVNQGLRGTQSGGHIALGAALQAQLVPPLGSILKDFSWMRRLRNAGDYPVPDKPLASAEDAAEALEILQGLLAKVPALLDAMPPYGKS